jgi:2C-methyl-D-erythritol 2,4-cyclodiphosphate synthase
LSARSGRARLLVASILARIDSDATQHALFDAAITASGGEQIDLLDQVAASIKRFGDHAEKRHLLNILDLIENSGGSTAEAAARVHGAMNLATTDAVRLIVEKDG